MIKDAIKILSLGDDLTQEQMKKSMYEIMEGEASPSQIGAFLALLKVKKETIDEITQAAVVMREKAGSVNIDEPVLDTCSTGGTGLNHLNISTIVAFIVAGSGVKVAKHGNRASSGKCGSADILEKLGVNINLDPQQVENCIREIGIGFLFAPVFHKAMKFAAGPRKEIGVRTVFNILGPLTSPASATHQLLGVFDSSLTETMAKVLGNLGTDRAMVVHGFGGLDEISLSGPTAVSELKDLKVVNYEINPQDFGLATYDIKEIKGSDADFNADMARKALEGMSSPYSDFLIANAAACLVILDKAQDFQQGVEIARDSMATGKAMKKLEELVDYSKNLLT